MLHLPQPAKIIKKEANKTIFEIEPLFPGYGITIGNALRRVLLSSLEGAAVTQMKIKGVAHEFSTIPGVLEDVITLMLNIKQLRFKLFGNEPQKATLKVKGEKEVKGSDFVLPPQVELVNKNCHLATLTTKSAELEMEIQIEKGIGYSPREERTKKKLETGTIAVDAIFTPVRRVSFRVEDMRVGERTDYNKLFLEIETDGTITPEEAFYQAVKILIEHFSIISASIEIKEEKKAIIEEKTTKKKKGVSKKTSRKKD
ncbi:MAG: DNA-directed RNA polymerase subunit alpha [Minisyncoccales bacterium]